MKPRPDHESALQLGVDVRKKLAKNWSKTGQNRGLWEGGALRLKTGASFIYQLTLCKRSCLC
ncbi:hypothetical protein CCP4SC76_1270001 [Gammaproteobacteria bacterium]